ncbi:hypothetical protein U9M48_023138 [Paspalum notatum var. saurae]|uniref:Histone-lysine N-methyltransferase ASHH2 n=1 Tax=Paspalum notatum var. saurae TaxID=547442 RepID=A0AAQ3WUC3_PASNO
MKGPGAAGARGGEDHGADTEPSRGAVEVALPTATAPELGDGLGDDGTQVRGAPEAGLSSEVDQEKGADFAVGLVPPVEAVEGARFQIEQEKSSSTEQRVVDVEEEKGGSLAPALQSTAEPGGLRTCHEANGWLSNKTLSAPCGEAVGSKGAGCVLRMLEKTAEGSQLGYEGLAGNGGDWGDKATLEDLQISCDEVQRDSEGSSVTMHNGNEQEPRSVDGIGSITDASNELQQDGFMPNIEAEVSRPVHGDSLPSISGSIDLSCLDRKTDKFGGVSSDPGGLPDLVKYDAEWLSCSMGVTCLNKNANFDLQKDGLLQKVGADNSWTLIEDSVPSISGGSVAASLDGKTGLIGELSQHRPGSAGCGTLSCEIAFHKEALGDEIRCSSKVNTSEEGLQTCQMEAAHDNGDFLGPGKPQCEKSPCGADGLTLIAGANHEVEKASFHSNIDTVASCPVDKTSAPSIYGNSNDVPVDGQAGQGVTTSENSACLEKLVSDSVRGDVLLCDSGLRKEAYGDGNLHSGPCADKESQQVSLKYGTSELTPERNQSAYSYNKLCDDEPCCSGKESSTVCLGHQDSAVGGSGHLDQGFNACNSADDVSVDFVSNAVDGESQSQKATLCVFRRRNPKRAASSRCLNSEKQDQMNKGSSGTRKPKKVDIASSLRQSPMSLFPNKIAKGRSGMKRPPKSCTWGSLKELLDGFCPSTSNSHPTCMDRGRSDNRSDQKSQPSIRKSRSSRSSKSKRSYLSGIGHAACELNGQPTMAEIGNAISELNRQTTFPTVDDADISLGSHSENIPKLLSDASFALFDGTSKTAESTNGSRSVKSKWIRTGAQQLERTLVSSNKETCPAYVHGECAKLSTSEPMTNANGSVMLHVGFSPDSVLEVASVTCEGNASASHDVMLNENSAAASALNGDSYHPSVLSTSNFGKEHALPLMILEQQAKTALHEDTRKEDIGPSHATVDDVGEEKIQALQKSNPVRKITIIRKPGCKKKDGTKGGKKNVIGCTKLSSCEASNLGPFSNDSISPEGTSGTQNLVIHEHDSIQSKTVMDGAKGSAFDSMKSPRRKKKDGNAAKKGKVRDQHNEKSKKKNIADDASLGHGLLNSPSTELVASHMNEQSNIDPATVVAFKNNGNVACKTDGASVTPPPRAAWVCCDDCKKWRCIPAELADVIDETNCRWTCKDNGDKAFADCSIPQVKSNAEINAELDLSDVSADEADNGESNSKACKQPSWTPVRSNLFMHRNRRTQSIDESMVCNCKPPQDGRMGCRDGCLNRMLNIECVKRTCPCGEQCSNQKFQRRGYAKLRWFHSGKKGYGLQLQEDVTEGRFLIEYVGEVLDITSYESRQRFYASKGQKHFYFMALNGGEVIDACTKGNLGRFINHSCSPNCRTEKWMVNGEVCIGIFAMRNIKKGEELTFDYNYVRVSGAAPQKCFCGTAKCRGYIGGDISVVDTITQDDPEAGHFEQMVVDKDLEELMGANGSDCDGGHPNIAESEFSIQGDDLHDCSAAKAVLESSEQTTGTLLFDVSEPENSLETRSGQEDEDVTRTPVHVSRAFESSLQQFPAHGTQSSVLLPKTANSMEVSKAPNVIGGLIPSSDFRSNVMPGFNANKRKDLKQHRHLKPQPLSPIDNEHILTVEGRLNKLLDHNGGISKRKSEYSLEQDATNGYLKLLLVTAAEGDSTSKSMRDLSLILDALLKTKSRSVLMDIINKNGLQMLHNMLKQNRGKFHRIPIIRKLLKVLEFLAQERILTYQHINGGPRIAGVESFRDSMVNLTWHKDSQVHQIARSFRDRWIHISARRKRKSRWDYQPEEHYKMVGLKFQKICSGHGEFDVQVGSMRNKLQRNQGTSNFHYDIHGMEEGADDEVPPGFESQQECRPAQLSIGSEVAPGIYMERYLPCLSISYGVPVALAERFGTSESEGGQCHQKWKVAPGVPFSPFPPLPPYPRGCPSPPTSQHDGTPPVKLDCSGHCGRSADQDRGVHRTWRNGQKTRWPCHQGRRFSSNHHRTERSEPPRSQ